MCSRYGNSTACQQLANMCAMTLHKREHTACSAILQIARESQGRRPRRVPVIFFPIGQTSSLLESESIQVKLPSPSL